MLVLCLTELCYEFQYLCGGWIIRNRCSDKRAKQTNNGSGQEAGTSVWLLRLQTHETRHDTTRHNITRDTTADARAKHLRNLLDATWYDKPEAIHNTWHTIHGAVGAGGWGERERATEKNWKTLFSGYNEWNTTYDMTRDRRHDTWDMSCETIHSRH